MLHVEYEIYIPVNLKVTNILIKTYGQTTMITTQVAQNIFKTFWFGDIYDLW